MAGQDGRDEAEDVDDLYALAPEAFVEARNALVRRLRAAKQREEAARVGALRRPPAAAWALNQVARRQPELVEAALDAGAELRRATEAATRGDASGLREAAATDRAAADAVVEAAVALLGRPAARPQLVANVRAAVLDEEIAAELRRGVLAADHEAAGFGFGFGLEERPDAPPDPVSARSRDRRESGKSGPSAEERRAERAARLEEEARAREERARRAEHEARIARLEQRVARLAQAADRAEVDARAARAAADEAIAELDAARRDLSR